MLFCGMAIIAGSGHVHIIWNLHALHLSDALENGVRDIRRIRSLPLCDSDCHTRVLLRHAASACTTVCRTKQDVIGGFRRPIDYSVGHISQVDGTSLIDSDDHRFEILSIGKQIAGVDANFATVLRETARLNTCIGRL
jgi:hypothetical protein